MHGFIQRVQREAIERTGWGERLDDPTFPLSGLYEPEGAVKGWMLTTLALWNQGMVSPEVLQVPTISKTQERVTYPFMREAWAILKSNNLLKRQVSLDVNLFLATAATGSMRAVVDSELIGDRHAVIFDAGLFLNLVAVGSAISDLLKDHDLAKSRFALNGHNFDLQLGQLQARVAAIDHLGELCAELLIHGRLFVGPAAGRANPLRDDFVPLFLRDSFLFLLAHEYAHIHLHHHDPANHDALSKLEDQADLFAFRDVCATIGDRNDPTLGVFCNVMLLFFCFELIYRTVHFAMKGLDYGHLDGKLQYLIHFGSGDRHLSPAGRRWRIAQLALGSATQLPSNFEEKVSCIEATLENVWRMTLVRTMARIPSASISAVWSEQIAHINLAYKAFEAQRGSDPC